MQKLYLSLPIIFLIKEGPYEETAVKPNALSVYGKHKLEAEQAVLAAGSNKHRYSITNVYGDEERGKNFIARIIEQIKAAQNYNSNFL